VGESSRSSSLFAAGKNVESRLLKSFGWVDKVLVSLGKAGLKGQPHNCLPIIVTQSIGQEFVKPKHIVLLYRREQGSGRSTNPTLFTRNQRTEHSSTNCTVPQWVSAQVSKMAEALTLPEMISWADGLDLTAD